MKLWQKLVADFFDQSLSVAHYFYNPPQRLAPYQGLPSMGRLQSCRCTHAVKEDWLRILWFYGQQTPSVEPQYRVAWIQRATPLLVTNEALVARPSWHGCATLHTCWWGLVTSEPCGCDVNQTMNHAVDACSITKLVGCLCWLLKLTTKQPTGWKLRGQKTLAKRNE